MTNPSQISLPDLNLSEASQGLIASTDSNYAQATEKFLRETKSLSNGGNVIEDKPDVQKLPSTSAAVHNQIRVSNELSLNVKATVTLQEFVKWMTSTPDLTKVGSVASKYPLVRANLVSKDANYISPWKLVERVNSALLRWVAQQTGEEDLHLEKDDVIPAAYLSSEMDGFS
ncbi:hypothetical protein PHMEG_00034539, partial [Phytophthora megakarya]